MRKLTLFTLGFAFAAALLVYCMGGVNWLAAAAAGGACALCFLLRHRHLRAVAVVLLGACVGALWCSVYTAFLPSAEPYCTDEEISFKAVAESAAMPTAYGFSVKAVLGEEELTAVLYFDEEVPGILPGDLLSGKAVFEQTQLYMTENDDLYRASHGIRLTGRLRGSLTVQEQTSVRLSHTLARVALNVKENIVNAFPPSSAGYFAALTVGDRSDLSFDFENRMSLCGLSHAVSLSGMHVSILMNAVYLLLFRKKKLAVGVGMPILVLFVILSGANPATVRAAVMQAVLFAGLLTKREYDPVTAVSAALLLLLLHSPWCIAQWGLQLSFLATLGIVVLCPRFLAWMHRLPIRSAFLHKALYLVLSPMAMTLAATVFTLPLSAVYFGVVSLAAPLCNLLCLWSVTVSFIGGLLTAAAGFFSPTFAQWMGAVLHLLYRYLDAVLSAFSSLSQTAVFAQTPLLFAWGIFAYLLVCAAILLRSKWYLVPMGLAVSLALCLLLHWETVRQDEFTVLDVGQGQCILCIRGDDAWVIDCGGRGEETGEIAARYLISRGITAVDGVILTHFDDDHTAGLSQLQKRVKVESVHTSDTVTEVSVFPLGDGSLTLYPAVSYENDNDTGLCILASAGDCDILITGDLSQKAEERFLACYPISDGDVLVAGHHGSASSTGDVLLNVFLPETVLISAGEKYDHPAAETLARIARSGAEAYMTKTEGNLTIRW